jgi:hypothetical protein
MFKRSSIGALAIGVAALVGSTAAYAGEIKGPPPTDNSRGGDGRISNGNSICSFSGLNDTPLGYGQLGDPDFDPGGQTQSFGSFFGSRGFPVSSLDPRTDELSPGFSCNPTRGPAFHG